MAYLHGKFVWFEHMSGDLGRAREFYGALFGWTSDGVDLGGQTYHMIMNGAAGIGGFRNVPPGAPAGWMGYLSVPDVDAAAARAQQAGAKILMPPADFPPVGRGATLADPQGAVFSLWKGNEGDRPDVDPVPMGDWCWHELMTSDVTAALAFYEGMFGYAHDAMDMGPQGTYYVLKRDDMPRAGLMKAPMPGTPPMWLPYVAVADTDGIAGKAATLGAKVVAPPADIPKVGRFAVLLDPLGAALGVIALLPRG